MRILKVIGVVLAGLIVVGGITFAVGPRVQVDERSMLPVEPPPDEPAAIERWVAEREARLDDLTPETQKRIVWADPAKKARTAWSVVYVHGYSATRQELAPVPEMVAKHLGANLFETRLRGHGRPGEAMGAARPEHWMEDTIEAMAIGERLGEQVMLIGCSTGATLAVWFVDWVQSARGFGPATRAPAALVLLSPNFGVPDPRSAMLTWPWGTQLVEAIAGETYTWEPANAGQRTYWTWSHPSRALVSMQALLDHFSTIPPDRPNVPTLAIWAALDQVVDVAAIEAWVAASPSRTPLELTDDVPRGNHVIAGRIMAPTRVPVVVEAINGFADGIGKAD